MQHVEKLRELLPESLRDVRLNLSAVLGGDSSLSPAQRWGTAVAAAAAAREPRLLAAILADARAAVDERVIEDARAAAALMAMNNVYYRFRHMVEDPAYAARRAGLRMNRLAQPAAGKADFELFSLAVSAIHGCATCVQSHERAVRAAGIGDEQVHDAVRVAAVVHSAATASAMLAAEALPAA